MENIQTSELETETQAVTPEIVTEMETQEVPSEEVDLDLEPNPTPEPPSPAPTVDYKQKFVESQREAILLAEREKIKADQIQKLTNTDTLTDDAMRQLYPDWDDYNEVTKRAFIKSEATEMKTRRLESQIEDLLNDKKISSELSNVIENEPKLSGKEAEFKKFATNPKNKGISPEILVKAFLFDVEEPAAPNVQYTEAIPQGNGGNREPLKSKKISLEEATIIRQTDYKKYKELLDSNMIDNDID